MITEWWAKLCTGYLEFLIFFELTASSEEKALIKKWLLGKTKSLIKKCLY